MRIKSVVLAAAVALGFVGLSRAENEMLYRLALDGNADKSGTGVSSVTTSGTADANWGGSENAKFGSNCFKSANAMAYVISNIETTKGAWTFSFWFHPNGMANWRDVLAFALGDKMGKFEKMGSDYLAIYNAASDSANAIARESALAYTAGTWNHIALVGTSTGFDLYCNGTKAASLDVNTTSGLSAVYIGCNGFYQARTSDALVDEVAIYNFSMTAEQIAILMQGEASIEPFTEVSVAIDSDTTWSDLLTAAGLTAEVAARKFLKVTATNTPKITFESFGNKVAKLTVEGAVTFAAADSLYVDGCVGGDLLSGTVVAPDATTPSIKEGFYGKYAVTGKAIQFYAQNAEVISINIGGGKQTADASEDANLVSGTDYYGLYPVPGNSWNNISGRWQTGAKTVTLTSAKAYDGAATAVRNSIQLSGAAKNTWQCDDIANPFLRGYLDDGGDGVSVTVTGVPYSKYDVIVYITSDDANYALRPIKINGTWWTYNANGELVESTGENGYDGDSWGAGKVMTPTIGQNAILITDVTGSELSVVGYRPDSSGARATVCAVQIISRGELAAKDFTANVTATTTWNGGNGTGLADKSGDWEDSALNAITLTNAADNATLTLDGEITAASLKIVCPEGKTLRLAKAADATLAIGNYNLTEAVGDVIFDFDPDFTKVDAGANWIQTTAAGSGTPVSGIKYLGTGNAWNFGSLSGGRYWLGGTGTLAGDNDVYGNATLTIAGTYTTADGATSQLGATEGTLTIAEGANVTVTHVKVQNSGSDTVATVNVNGRVTVTSASDSNVYGVRASAGILFGHYYGSTVVTVGPNGALVGENCWLQMTYTSSTTLTINGGLVKVKGLNAGGSSSTLVVTNGGTLELADGLSNQNNCAYTFDGGTLKCAAEATLAWTPTTTTVGENGFTVDVNGQTVTFENGATFAGEGPIAFVNSSGTAGVVDLRTSRPTQTLSIGAKVTVKVTLANEAEMPVLKVASEPAAGAFVLVDSEGSVIADEDLTVTYDAEAGTVTLVSGKPTWTKGETSSFEAAANWNTLPVANGEAIVKISGTTAIEVSEVHAFSKLTISGNGLVTFTGTGTITASATAVAGGADVVFPAGYAFGALTVEDGAKATSDGGASVTSLAGYGTFAITNGTIATGSNNDQNQIWGVRNTIIENGGVLSLAGRDTFTVAGDANATLTVNAGGKFTSSSFNSVPKVYLNGGTIETTGSWGSSAWASICYNNGLVAGGETTSYLTTTVPENAYAGHQLATGIFEVQQGATLDVTVALRNSPGDRGSLNNQVRKIGAGQMIVRVTPAYSGATAVNEGRYVLNAAHVLTGEAGNYTVASGAALTGTGSVSGAGAVVLNSTDSILGGSLTVENLTFVSGAQIGNVWNPADVTLTGVVTNSNLNSSGLAWLNVNNGSLTLGSGAEITTDLCINVATDGCLAAGAGETPVTVTRIQSAGAGARLASEVKSVNGVKTTGSFALAANFNLANWTVGLKPVGNVRPPTKVPVVSLADGCSFSGFNRKAVPENAGKAFLGLEGQTLYYFSNQYFHIILR